MICWSRTSCCSSKMHKVYNQSHLETHLVKLKRQVPESQSSFKYTKGNLGNNSNLNFICWWKEATDLLHYLDCSVQFIWMEMLATSMHAAFSALLGSESDDYREACCRKRFKKMWLKHKMERQVEIQWLAAKWRVSSKCTKRQEKLETVKIRTWFSGQYVFSCQSFCIHVNFSMV